MKNNSITSFIIVLGIIIFIIFSSVLLVNLLPSYESNSYYGKVDVDMDAKLEYMHVDNYKLNIKTFGNAIEFCVKATRTTPEINNICWKKLNNNNGSVSVYRHKKYYVWIKDSNNNISTRASINTN